MALLHCPTCNTTWILELRVKVCPTCKREGQRVLVSEVVKRLEKKQLAKK